jgi:hypothetical protein
MVPFEGIEPLRLEKTYGTYVATYTFLTSDPVTGTFQYGSTRTKNIIANLSELCTFELQVQALTDLTCTA